MSHFYTQTFFQLNPVFSKSDFDKFLTANGTKNRFTRDSILNYHLHKGRLKRLKQNLYAVLFNGDEKEREISIRLIAAKAASDAIPAFHTALEIYGLYYSVYYVGQFFTNTHVKPFYTSGYKLQPFFYPKSLVRISQQWAETQIIWLGGVQIRVPTIERVVVDALYNISACGGWEEVWRGLESLSAVDYERILSYALLLENATLIGLIGFFLELNRKKLGIPDAFLEKLESWKPKYPQLTYQADKQKSILISRWNIRIPLDVHEEKWDEISQYEDNIS